MTYDHRAQTAEHREISALIPWYVNASISERERERVDTHLAMCASCREDLAHEMRVFKGMTAESSIEYMPAPSLKRLQARLEQSEPGPPQVVDARPASRSPRRSMPWQGLMAASVAVMALALSWLATDRWLQYRARASAPNYYTVTTPRARARDEVIRAVFAPTVKLLELQSILDEAQLRIISGPTEAGVYSLAANSPRPVSSSLALLRAHPEVRFAESTAP